MPPRKKVEVAEEPLEAQPPVGIVLDDPVFVGEASDAEMQRLVEAARKAVEELDEDVNENLEVEVEMVAPSVSVKCGGFVTYVLGRDIIEDLKVKGVGVGSLAMGDTAPALVIRSHADGSVDLRVFVDAEDVPVRRGVKQIPFPSELTLDHVNYFYLEK